MKKILLSASVIVLFSCEFQTSESSQTITTKSTFAEDSSIQENVRSQIASLNKIAIEAILNNDISGIAAIESINLKKQDKTEFEAAFTYMNDQLTLAPQSTFKEYHVVSSREAAEHNLTNKIEIGQNGDSILFDITYTSPQKESYLCVLKMSSDFCERLLTLIYGKYDHEWKLDYMAVGTFKINGLTSPEHLEVAKKFRAEKKLAQALTSVQLSQLCSAPIYKLLTYRDQEQIAQESDEIIKEFNAEFPLPMDLNSIGIAGQILGISMAPIKIGKYFPTITYLTSTSLNDTSAIENECTLLHSKIERLLPGIKTGFHGLIYGPFNENPEENPQAASYNLLRETPTQHNVE